LNNLETITLHHTRAHHINDLLESDAEGEHESLRLIEYRPVLGVVVGQQRAQQALLVGSTDTL